MQVDSTWKYVCDDAFDSNNNGANVACRELGFASGTHSNGVAASDSFYDDVHCTGSEAKLADCSRSTGEDCGTNEAVTLQCIGVITFLRNFSWCG